MDALEEVVQILKVSAGSRTEDAAADHWRGVLWLVFISFSRVRAHGNGEPSPEGGRERDEAPHSPLPVLHMLFVDFCITTLFSKL